MVWEERRAFYHERHREIYCYRSRSCFAQLVLLWTAIWDFKVQKTNLIACLLIKATFTIAATRLLKLTSAASITFLVLDHQCASIFLLFSRPSE